MKGVSILDYTYVIILFLLIAVVIIGILILTSKQFMEDIRTGKIYDRIEEILKKVIRR